MNYLIEHPQDIATVASVALVFVCLVGELSIAFLIKADVYERRDTVANLIMYGGFLAVNFLWLPIVFLLYSLIHHHALWDLGHQWWLFQGTVPGWHWVALFFADDLCFYLFHRTSHKVSFLWASHVTHHSSQNFNLSVGLRQTWVPFFAMVFWLPSIILGFDPLMVLTMQLISLTFQALLHTQLIKSFGLLDFIFNSPSHHRAHHGTQSQYVDKNFGGVLIMWDRLFGTHEKETVRPIYGNWFERAPE